MLTFGDSDGIFKVEIPDQTLASAEALEVATRQGYSLGTALRLENQTLNSLELRISGWVGIKWLGEDERTAD